MYYPDELVEEIRERNDIVDVISSFVGLKRAGNSYTCCCPFHSEKTPSFHVSKTKQIYHCFGCGAGGNVVTFLMQYENYTFTEALKYLADRAGIALPEEEMTPEKKKTENRKEQMRDRIYGHRIRKLIYTRRSKRIPDRLYGHIIPEIYSYT